MSDFTPIDWKQKVNSPELIAFLQQFGEEHYLSAEEINELVSKINALYSSGENLKLVINGKQVKDSQIEIDVNSSVSNVWNGQTVLFTANCTITVPSTLNASLMFMFRTLPGVTVTWLITSPFVWETTPNPTGEKTVGHFMRRGSTNTIFLDV